jgi:hypothetical protein
LGTREREMEGYLDVVQMSFLGTLFNANWPMHEIQIKIL